MSYVSELASVENPIDKAKALLILSKVKFNDDGKPDHEAINSLISEYNFDNSNVQLSKLIHSNKDIHRNQLIELESVYMKELIKEHVVEKVKNCDCLSELSNKDLIEYSEILGAYLVATNLKTSQVRKFLDNIRQLENETKRKYKANSLLPKEYMKKLVEKYIIKNINECDKSTELSNVHLIEYSEILGTYFMVSRLTVTQMKKFLDGLRQLENYIKSRTSETFSNENLLLLKVHLIYAAAREKKAKPFMMVINTAIDKVRKNGQEGFEDFKKLVKFIEAIIAYHKYYGGSE